MTNLNFDVSLHTSVTIPVQCANSLNATVPAPADGTVTSSDPTILAAAMSSDAQKMIFTKGTNLGTVTVTYSAPSENLTATGVIQVFSDAPTSVVLGWSFPVWS